MGGECSHHCAIPAPQKMLTRFIFKSQKPADSNASWSLLLKCQLEKEKNWYLNLTVDKIKSWTHSQLGFDLFTYTCDQQTRVLSQAREEERGPWKRDGRPCRLMRNTLLHLWALYTRGCFPAQKLMSTKLVNCVRHWKTLSLSPYFFVVFQAMITTFDTICQFQDFDGLVGISLRF